MNMEADDTPVFDQECWLSAEKAAHGRLARSGVPDFSHGEQEAMRLAGRIAMARAVAALLDTRALP